MFNIKIPFVIASHVKKYSASGAFKNKSKAGAVGILSNQLQYHNGTSVLPLIDTTTAQVLTNKTINGATGVVNLVTYTGDAAITLVSQVALLTKGSAAAMSVAAPGAAGVGARITIVSGSNFAHVITFTGGTLGDGTTGLNTTVTMTAFIGSSITVIGNTATQWVVESQNVLTSIA